MSEEIDYNNELFSFLPNFIKEHNVSIVDNKNATTSDLIQLIIEKYGPTGPFYIVNIGDILRRVQLWKKLFPTIESHYAVKSNPSPVMCKLLGSCGLGFDVASINEINLVKNIVQDLNKIVFAHPIKPVNAIVYARTVDVDYLVFDSEHELYKIKLYHPHAKLILRLKTDDKDSECRFSEKYGTDKEDIEVLLELASKMKLNVIGVSFHVGSNCKNPHQYYTAIETAKYAFDIGATKDFKFNLVDIGGGFSGHSDETSLKLLSDTSFEIYRAMKDFFDYEVGKDNDIRLIAEQGRYFSTSSYTLVLSVIGKRVKIDKETGEKVQTIFINNGTYSSFSAINYDHQKPVIMPYNNDDIEKFKTVVNGETCDSLDRVCENVMLPELEVSDLVYVEEFGAYTIASSSQFNGFCVKDFFYVMT